MTSLQDKIKTIVLSMNAPEPAEPLFHYSYGKDHWQNLCDHEKDAQLPFEERSKYFKLLYVDEEDVLNEYSAVEGCNYSGELLILASSKLTDASYEYKFETHIKKLKELANSFREKINDCDNWIVKSWTKIEIENIYDNNLDGIKVRFRIYHG